MSNNIQKIKYQQLTYLLVYTEHYKCVIKDSDMPLKLKVNPAYFPFENSRTINFNDNKLICQIKQ